MNKKLVRTGPKIRITRPTKLRVDIPQFHPKGPEAHRYVFTCQYCRLKFTQNSQFFRHMTSNHALQQQQATYQCNECHIVFSKKAVLDIHYQSSHRTKSKSKCESCAITFKSRYCLRRHLKLKQLMQENACLKCNKKFVSKDGLAKHVKNKHTFKNITYQCDTCSIQFKAKESLLTHLNRIHKKL